MRWSAIAVLAFALATPARAELAVGAQAPDFTIPTSLAGKPSTFALADALKKGPVVLYFYPKAFTQGCTVEAHEFSEATDSFAALGATVIGISNDTIETLNKFSVTECRNKFAVGADTNQAVMKAYDAVFLLKPDLASRTSYVITPDHRINYVYTALDPSKHVENTIAAVKAWKATQAGTH